MAVDADREATKARLLAMAADYEARAMAATGADPKMGDAANETVEPAQENEAAGLTKPGIGGTLTSKPDRKTTQGLKETIVVERRPVGRTRRE
jgi:hypothetical protein